MSAGRIKGVRDLVAITPRLRSAIHSALGSGGRRWEKKIPVSATWLRELGYRPCDLSKDSGSQRTKQIERETSCRAEGLRLRNLKSSSGLQPQMGASGKKPFEEKNNFGKAGGSTFTTLAKSSLQKIFEDQPIYEKAFKLFKNRIQDLPNWESIKLGGIRNHFESLIRAQEELTNLLAEDSADSLAIDRAMNSLMRWSDTTLGELKKNAPAQEQPKLRRVPMSIITAFTEMTEGMAPDATLYEVRRYLGKRKRLTSLAVSHQWKRSLMP